MDITEEWFLLLILANTFKSGGQNGTDEPDREGLGLAVISDLLGTLLGVQFTSRALIWQQLLIRVRSIKKKR